MFPSFRRTGPSRRLEDKPKPRHVRRSRPALSLERLEDRLVLTFPGGVTYPTGLQPLALASGDFNGDHTADLVVANSGSSNVSILLGNGDGAFRGASNISVGSPVLGAAVGDFN